MRGVVIRLIIGIALIFGACLYLYLQVSKRFPENEPTTPGFVRLLTAGAAIMAGLFFLLLALAHYLNQSAPQKTADDIARARNDLLLSTAILTGLSSISASLISSPSDGAFAGIALLFAAIHFVVTVWFLRRIRSALKWFL